MMPGYLRLEGRISSYELKLKLPKPTPIIQEKHDTIVEVKTVIDTIAIPQVRKKMPLALYTLATLSLHEDGPSYLTILKPCSSRTKDEIGGSFDVAIVEG